MYDPNNLDFRIVLPVAFLFAPPGFRAVFEDDYFPRSTLLQDFGLYCHTLQRWLPDLYIFPVGNKQHLIKYNTAFLGVQFLNFDFLPGKNQVLLPPGFNDGQHKNYDSRGFVLMQGPSVYSNSEGP